MKLSKSSVDTLLARYINKINNKSLPFKKKAKQLSEWYTRYVNASNWFYDKELLANNEDDDDDDDDDDDAAAADEYYSPEDLKPYLSKHGRVIFRIEGKENKKGYIKGDPLHVPSGKYLSELLAEAEKYNRIKRKIINRDKKLCEKILRKHVTKDLNIENNKVSSLSYEDLNALYNEQLSRKNNVKLLEQFFDKDYVRKSIQTDDKRREEFEEDSFIRFKKIRKMILSKK
jgi:hypothetical protein